MSLQESAETASSTKVDDEARKRRIQKAVSFLKNPQVQASPLARRVNFLKSKGLTAEDITEAFQNSGNPQTLDSIQNIMNQHQTSQPVTRQQAGQQQPVVCQSQQLLQPSPATQPAYAPQQLAQPQQHQPLVYVPLPTPPQPQEKSRSWKDYYIGATAVAAAGFIVSKLVQHFVPYRIVRMPPAEKEKRKRRHHVASSGDDDSDSNVRRTAVEPAPPPPALPVPEPVSQKAPQHDALQNEVSELKDKLESERKEKADLVGMKGRLHGQLMQLTRAAEKDSAEKARLHRDLQALTEELDALKAKSEAQELHPASEPQETSEASKPGDASA